MNKSTSFILNNVDEKEIKHIMSYIRNQYCRGCIIYDSVGFCVKLSTKLFPAFIIDESIDDTYYKNLNATDAKDIGLIGKIYTNPIICVPELNEINAVIVPDWCNHWGKYFEKENENE